MNLTENQQQNYKMMWNLGLESLKVFMACLLIIFVPQKCYGRDCTIAEKLENEKFYTAFCFNLLTLFAVIKSYTIEYLREKYIIDHFDINKRLADNNLRFCTELNPGVLTKLHKFNKRFYKYSKYSIIMAIVNLLFSSGLIIGYHYSGFKSTASILTNSLLLSNTLSSNYNISAKCVDTGLALSTTSLEPVSYNELDPKFRVIEQLVSPEEPSLPQDVNDSEIRNPSPSTVVQPIESSDLQVNVVEQVVTDVVENLSQEQETTNPEVATQEQPATEQKNIIEQKDHDDY
tara:strand:+ start:259 stop:1125 length:867 start_codon:yes stop_codon:yes gene_type:complete